MTSFSDIPSSEGAHIFPGFKRRGHLCFLSSVLSGFILLPVSGPHFPALSHQISLVCLPVCHIFPLSSLGLLCTSCLVHFSPVFSCLEYESMESIFTNVFCETLQWGQVFLYWEICMYVCMYVCMYECLSGCLTVLYSTLDALILPFVNSRTPLSDQCVHRDAGAHPIGNIVWPWFCLLSTAFHSLFPISWVKWWLYFVPSNP